MAKKVKTQDDALKKLEAQLECSFCLDNFKDPKLLPCFHTFCKSPCLEKLVSKDGNSITCPICRHVAKLPEKGIAGLQSDFNIARLIEVKEAFDTAQDSNEKQCENCEEDKATGYCNDCQEFLCDSCQEVHKKVKKFKTHALLTLDELQAQASKLIPPKKPPPNCSKHPENPLKIYCETCQELICNDCTIRQHREHNFDLVADLFHKHKQQLVSSLEPVKEKLHKAQDALEVLDLTTKEIQEQRVSLEVDIHKEINELHTLLDQRRAVLLEKLEKLTQQKVKQMAAQRDQVDMIRAKLNSCVQYAEGGLETGTEGEVLAIKSSVLERIEQILAEFNPDSLEPETGADLELVLHKKQLQQASQDSLELTENNSFSLLNSKLDLAGLSDVTIGQQETVTYTAMSKRNSPFKRQLEIKVELSDRENKSFTKCEVEKPENGQHIISYTPKSRGDKLHINVNGKHVPGSPFIITVLPSPECFQKPTKVVQGLTRPRGVAVNSKGHIVVVESDGCTVSVLTPNGDKKISSFGSEGSENGQSDNAFGVTIDKEDNIYIVDTNNHRVQKFDADGNFQKKVGSEGEFGHLSFKFPLGITYNHNDNLLYVADNNNHRIQVLTTDLTFVRVIGKRGKGNGEFSRVIDVKFDRDNNLYVADYENNRVQVLTPTGKYLRSFSNKSTDQQLQKPWALGIDSRNFVYVSEYRSRFVNVFSPEGAFVTLFEDRITCFGFNIDSNDTIILSDYNQGCLHFY